MLKNAEPRSQALLFLVLLSCSCLAKDEGGSKEGNDGLDRKSKAWYAKSRDQLGL